MESTGRRLLWVVVTVAWPAMAGARAEFHAGWTGHLWLPCAVAEMGCALVLRFWQARARELEREQEKRDAECRLAELEGQVSAYGKALAAMDVYGHAREGCCPEPGQARLRVVQGKRA
jgi:hypothetical protein